MRSVKTVPCRTQEWDFYYNPYSMVSDVERQGHVTIRVH